MRKSLVAAVLTASTLALASCAMPADDPNFNASAAALDPEQASAAAVSEAALQTALAAPTSIGVEAPLPAPAPADISIVSLTDGSDFQGVFDKALGEAAAALKWKVDSVTIDPNDATSVTKAFDDALAKKPGGIHITGNLVTALADSLPKAAAAGVPVVCTGCSGDPAGGITDTSIDGTAQNLVWGDVMASYVVGSQYQNEDAGVQIFSLPSGALQDFNIEFDAALQTQCRNCSTSESPIDPASVDLTDPTAVTSFIVGEMTTSLGAWALLDSGSLATGVADALATDPTLLSPVVLIGRGAGAADIEALKALGGAGPTDGATGAAPSSSSAASASAAPEASPAASGDSGGDTVVGRTAEQAAALQAWIAIPQPVMAWRVIDQFARLIGGGTPETGPLPSQLLTGSNAADAVLDADGNYIGIADYQDQFKALWGVK